ncbi:transportin MOS14-like [Camellia sinensis]|uniref:transportin MOS14-like n=1 Tax=Camellia sinensis TaxID=4442 RepID=UPI0010364679|nr:transportin MOS14-like [Camellia sinensis]
MCDTLGKATWGLFKCFKVSDNLLHDASSNQETLIFCSQTLRSKVQRDFEELPSEAFRPLRDLLNISLAVAALAVHVPAKDWGDGGIVNWLRDEMNSHHECHKVLWSVEKVMFMFLDWVIEEYKKVPQHRSRENSIQRISLDFQRNSLKNFSWTSKRIYL